MRNRRQQLSERQLFFHLRAILHACRGRLTLCLLTGAVILAERMLRGNKPLMRQISGGFVQPVHRFLSVLTGHVRFSTAELLILTAALLLSAASIRLLVLLIRGPSRLDALIRYLSGVAAFVLSVYAGFCLLWGVYYYGDDFATKAGMEAREISIEELEVVTVYFAAQANQYAGLVPRDADGVCVLDRNAVLEKSKTLYHAVETNYPWLSGPEIRAKGWRFSKLLSLTDFTGFFFPFTAEANVNTDSPSAFFPATVAHELAHQRGVAKEQEANFCAVLASLEDGDPAYCYSACLLAYTHLSNALYSVNPGAWQLVSKGLDERVKADYRANRSYWARFETPVQKVSNTVYEDFLYSYDQELGLRSYGACVDLLVLHYEETAKAFFQS
ncbi:MAG: DUF3810 domain-containing protein [Oscillospiraceae bacterium]|nr:DUF3810 domain-containing protein [Oscillospiraceae bacterium]